MKSPGEMTQLEMAAYVQSLLEVNGIKVILSGGVATTLHSDNQYVSYDFDLVNIFSSSRKSIKNIISTYGFIEENRYFKHPSSKFFIEFPPGPLTVGQEPVREVDEVKLETGILKVISPTDSVKDRLAAYYHWGDQQSLKQALLIARTKKVDLDEVKRWSENEGKIEEFKTFINKATEKI
jgi:hypothetical protein